jgi:hypothetical protein
MATQYKPILFSTEMVQAILEGRKKLTRRTQGLEIINKNPDDWFLDGLKILGRFIFHNLKSKEEIQIKPKFEIGDILWVRETWQTTWNENKKSWDTIYKADGGYWIDDDGIMKWKPSIFMPKKKCRIFLEITDVRVERLQDISEEDAIAEGIKKTWINDDIKQCRFKNYINDGKGSKSPIDSFNSLWVSINGKDSWKANPWVWVYEFKVVEKPKDFTNEH